jgi:hypothetical protein
MSRSNLKRIQKVVRTKRGSARRTFWVKADEAPKPEVRQSFLRRHAGKIAVGTAALVGATVFAKHRHGAVAAAEGAHAAYKGARIADHASHLLTGRGIGVGNHYRAVKAGASLGYAAGSIADQGRRKVYNMLGISPTLMNLGYGVAALSVVGIKGYRTAQRIIQHVDRAKGVHRRIAREVSGVTRAR